MKFTYTILKLVLLASLVAFNRILEDWFLKLGVHSHIILPLINFLIFVFSSSLIVTILSWIYRRRKKLEPNRNDNVLIGFHNIYYLVIGGAVIFFILSLLGIDYRTLFTSLSIVAAAIAIISKDYISEVISGIIISFSTEISIGDQIKIGEHRGKIIGINLTKVALLNDDDDIIFIPNNKVFTSETINYTKRQIRKVSIDFDVDLKFIKTAEEMETDLIQAISEFAPHIEEGSYYLKIVEIRKDSLHLKFQYTLLQADRQLEKDVRRKTVRSIVNFVKQHYFIEKIE